jgi:hypothetical protein
MWGDGGFDGADRLQVRNGFKSELLRLAGGEDQLRIELDRAAEWIGPKTPPQIMKSKVRGRVQSQVSERKDRDRRYEMAKTDNSKKSNDAPKDGEHNGVWYLNGRPCTDKAEYDHWHGLLTAQ